MDGIIFGACTVAGVIATLLCARRAMHHPRVFTWLIAVAFGVCTVGVFFAIPAVAETAEDVTGLDNAGKLVAHICAILWCAALQMTMVDLAYRPEYLRTAMYQRGFAAVVELAVMVPLFLATNGEDVEFTTAYADHPSVAAYLLVYLSYVLVTCGELAFMCGRTARRCRTIRPWTGAGFTLGAVAAVLGVGYTLSKGSYIVFHALDRPWSLDVEEKLSPALSGLAVLFLFAGLTMPMLGGLVQRLRGREQSPQGLAD
ncbi:hypothetical protein MHW47_17465 [Streptomyces sp. OfavH-34-F]|uniref:hypothetical protein n=1 Tax=Streptomyces sp. OfavH-34-F TaxID=2917760 RepID=UPI001EF31A32|nr:hypothetical protein [Streptomyces sp. OfavH-34-F]MCG7526225.1 hypothetical protein [Streptomyces sp. OfavH-34-F]